jgi:IS30 family transposase
VKGKPWTIEEEKMLRQMVEHKKSVRVIARTLGKTRDGVRMKIGRLELEEVVQPKSERTTSTRLALTKDLPTVEEALKTLNAALEALKTSGLEQSEILRLRSIIQGVKIYQELFADYMHYCEIEAELVELRRGYEDLVKKAKDDESKAVHE